MGISSTNGGGMIGGATKQYNVHFAPPPPPNPISNQAIQPNKMGGAMSVTGRGMMSGIRVPGHFVPPLPPENPTSNRGTYPNRMGGVFNNSGGRMIGEARDHAHFVPPLPSENPTATRTMGRPIMGIPNNTGVRMMDVTKDQVRFAPPLPQNPSNNRATYSSKSGASNDIGEETIGGATKQYRSNYFISPSPMNQAQSSLTNRAIAGDMGLSTIPGKSIIGDRTVPSGKDFSTTINEGIAGAGSNQNKKEADMQPLPAELTKKFQALYCELCELKMTSNAMAKIHYKSKNHEKKIRRYLLADAAAKGVDPHPFALLARQKSTENEDEKNPKYFYCDVCDLSLTGKLHAESHYMGKHHNAVMMGKRKPSGKVFYDSLTGKWIRDTKPKKNDCDDGYNDNFGMAFRPPPPPPSSDSGKKEEHKQEKCTICDVSCTSQEQMQMHLNGTKHRKKLKSMGVCPEDVGLSTGNTNEPGSTVTSKDFSKYKTPSGQFYCKKCNLSLNSDLQLTQHLNSKNHAKKIKEDK